MFTRLATRYLRDVVFECQDTSYPYIGMVVMFIDDFFVKRLNANCDGVEE